MHQNPINTEIQEDNYTQTPLQFSVTREPYLILMTSIAYRYLWRQTYFLTSLFPVQ